MAEVAIVLDKGARIDLQKASPGLKRVRVAIRWGKNTTDTGTKYDLDISAFGLKHVGEDKNPVCPNPAYFLFYSSVNRTSDNKTVFIDNGPYPKKGQPCFPDLSLVHSGDNTDGSGDGDDEVIICDVVKALAALDEISFIATIEDAVVRKQNFGQIPHSVVKILNDETNELLASYDLGEVFSTETAVQLGSLYKNAEGHLGFKAVGQGYNIGLAEFCSGYGLTAK